MAKRVPSEVAPTQSDSWYAKKRSTLAAGLVFTSPGIPMLFQGQEFLQHGWFQDTGPLDWDLTDKHDGIVDLYRDLISLRLNKAGTTRGLSGHGVNVHHVIDRDKVIAFHRWDRGGVRDEVIVVANFSARSFEGYRVGFPHAGLWKLRFNSNWEGYSPDFGGILSFDVRADPGAYDRYSCHGNLSVAPYSLLIFSQETV